MEHFITGIHIAKVRHLENVDIPLGNEKRKHLILTGKNGSGKTSVLEGIKSSISLLTHDSQTWVSLDGGQSRFLNSLKQAIESNPDLKGYNNWSVSDIRILFNSNGIDLSNSIRNGKFITAYFPANRTTTISNPNGVEDVKLNRMYPIEQSPVKDFVKYLVHLKTQQSYARNEGDLRTEVRIENWFNIFIEAIQKLMDDSSIKLKFDYKNYNFFILQKSREQYDFSQLSDGYSAAICIVADLMMRLDQNWLLNNRDMSYDIEGIALIDEIETHLHLELQKTILPFLTKMFPRIQFIVTTHSPFVVSSLDNAVVYDLENKTMIDGGLTNYAYDSVVEGYFRVDKLSNEMREKYSRYKELVKKKDLTDDDLNEIMDLELYLDEIPDYLALDIASEYSKMKLEFDNREDIHG